MLKINGEIKDEIGSNLLEYLKKNNYNQAVVAVEINGTIVRKTDFDKTTLMDGDIVEIVSFVGGG